MIPLYISQPLVSWSERTSRQSVIVIGPSSFWSPIRSIAFNHSYHEYLRQSLVLRPEDVSKHTVGQKNMTHFIITSAHVKQEAKLSLG